MTAVALFAKWILLLALFLVLRWILKQLFSSWFMHCFSPVSQVPSPPVNSLFANTIGDPCWGEIAYLRGLDARTVISYVLYRAQTLGPIFMLRGIFGYPVVHVLDADALRTVLITSARKYTKPVPMKKLLAPLIGDHGIILSEGEEHRKIRKRVAPCFHNRAISMFSQTALVESKRFAAGLLTVCRGDVTTPLPLKLHAGVAACRSILKTFFPADELSDTLCEELESAYGPIFDSMTSVLYDDILQSVFDILPSSWLTQSVSNKRYICKEVLKLLTRTQDLLKRKESQSSNSLRSPASADCDTNEASKEHNDSYGVRSMLEIMLRPSLSDGQSAALNGTELIDNTRTFLAAGQATAAMIMTWSLYRLAKHPKWLSRLQDELDSCKEWLDENEEPDIRVAAIENLPVLDRVVKECIRMHPPVLSTVRQLNEPDVLGRYALGAGTLVVIPIYAMHMNPAYWDHPDSFDPERFLPHLEAKRDRMAWIPFLHGTRKCMAQRFVLREVKCMIAAVVQVMDLETDPVDAVPVMRGGLAGHPEASVYGHPRC